jgi:hypothetical protein
MGEKVFAMFVCLAYELLDIGSRFNREAYAREICACDLSDGETLSDD